MSLSTPKLSIPQPSRCLDVAIIFFATWTIYANLFTLLRAEWKFLYSFSFVPLVLSLLWAYKTKPSSWRPPDQSTTGTVISLLSLATIAVFGIVFFVHRPDADDNYYLNLIVSILDNPDYKIFQHDTILREPNLPILLPAYKVTSYELFVAWISQLTRIDYRYTYFFVLPTITSFLSLIAFFRFISLYLKDSVRYLALTITIILIIIWGETHLAYGNRMFVRLFQGKGVLITLAIPIIYVYANEFSKAPNWISWMKLALAQIFALGLSSSAIVLAPIASTIGILSTVIANRKSFKIFFWGLTASTYLIIAALILLISNRGGYGEIGTPADIFSSLGNSPRNYLAIAFILFGLFGSKSILNKRLYIIFISLILLFTLNPIVSNILSTYVARNMSWRLAWAAPIPLLMSIGVTSFIAQRKKWQLTIATLMVIYFSICDRSSISVKNGVFYGWAKLKVPTEYYSAELISSLLTRDTLLLAPEPISVWIPTFHSHPRQLISRKGEIIYLVPHFDAVKRINMQRTLEGQLKEHHDVAALLDEVAQRKIQAIVIDQRSPTTPMIKNLLGKKGFAKMTEIDRNFTLYMTSELDHP